MMSEQMNAEDTKKIVDFVEKHLGCSLSDIRNALPEITDLPELLRKMSEGAKVNEGFVLVQKDGAYYIGPNAYLV